MSVCCCSDCMHWVPCGKHVLLERTLIVSCQILDFAWCFLTLFIMCLISFQAQYGQLFGAFAVSELLRALGARSATGVWGAEFCAQSFLYSITTSNGLQPSTDGIQPNSDGR